MNKSTDAEASVDSYAIYIGADLNLPDSDGNPVRGVVSKQIRNDDGDPVGFVNHNPLLDTITYGVQYMDDLMEEIISNQIAENMLLQLEYEGMNFLFLN